MAESLLQKAQRLGIQPAATSTGETLIQKAQRLGIQPAQQTEQPNYFERVGQNFAQTGKEITDSIQKGAETYSTESAKGNVFKATGGLLRSGLRTVGGVAEAAFNPIFELPIVKGVVEKIGQKVLGVPQIKDFVTEATLLAEQYPEQATDLKNIVDILTLGGGKAVEKPLLQEGKLIAKDIAGSTQAMLSTSEEAVQKNIIEMFNKSVKPTAKKTIAQGQKYENDTLNALKTIKANAEKLNIEDATGEIITGRTPQSLNELAQGLDQTKKIVFNQYDTLAKEAGAVGATIDAKPIADEVLKVAQNRALQITNPEVVKYAEQWAERLRGLDMLDTETTQAVIQNLNNNLQAFYKNPTYEAASKVAVDAGVVNNFRKALDDAIEGATGEQYQAIKRQYGALKAIENDVTRAAMRDARKNVKGLLDYTDMFTSGQMLGGILQLNPAMFTKGAIERGFKEYFKFLNDPNRAIENIFENLNIKTGDVFKPQSTIGKYLENPKLGMSIEDVSKTASKADDNLLSEARKYKSAEDFVKAQELAQQEGVVYHGGRDIGDKGTLTFGNYGRPGSGQDSGAIFLTPSRKYANGYVKSDGALYRADINLAKEKIFDATKPADIAKLSKLVDEYAINSIKESTRLGAADWATLSQYLDEIEKAGFTGAKFLERPGENIEVLANGGFKVSGKPVYSYGMFKEVPVTKVQTKSQLTDIWEKANKK